MLGTKYLYVFEAIYYSVQPRASRVSGVPGMAIAMPQATKHDKELRAALPAHGHTSKVSLEKSATKSQPPDLPHVQATGFELLSWVCGSSPPDARHSPNYTHADMPPLFPN